MTNSKLYDERVNRLKTALSLGQPDRVPLGMTFDGVTARLCGSSYRDLFYDFEKASKAIVEFYKKYPMCDYASIPSFVSGISNELAGTRVIDWPGRPGTMVSDYSTHQIIEYEFMEPEEYPELLSDPTGFILRKYIPRVFGNVKGLDGLSFNCSSITSSSFLDPLTTPEFLESVKLLGQIGEQNRKAADMQMKLSAEMESNGFPEIIYGFSEAPYDIVGDYFRGTMGIFEDILDEDILPYVEQACEMFADQQIEALQYLRYIDAPLKTVFFPLHKGMDGFLSDKLYEKLYWKPLRKIMMALIEMDTIPYIYTEGPYNTRLDYLADVPKGKVYYHFEKVDMKKAKEIVGPVACISGNLSVTLMEFGTKERVIQETRELLETCMPGGGYIFDFNANLENTKEENLDALFETLEKYGKY